MYRAAGLIALAFASVPADAFAYRPFDSTDPAVAELGQVEVELGPLSYRNDDSGRTWIAPQLRLNYGFTEDWEVILEGQDEFPQHGQNLLVENALSLKYVIKDESQSRKTLRKANVDAIVPQRLFLQTLHVRIRGRGALLPQ